MTPQTVYIDALAVWSPQWIDWPSACSAFSEDDLVPDAPASAAPTEVSPAPRLRRPLAALLAPAERRRAPDTVALALEVAAAAVAASGQRATDLLAVFTSAHGDLAINDAMCSTLARNPHGVSPTKFVHSVHNVAAGYWAIATGGLVANTAVSAGPASFAAGCLEAVLQCAADQQPVLLVGYDMQGVGALAGTVASQGTLAVALVMSPCVGPHSLAALTASLRHEGLPATPLRSAAAESLANTGMADALPVLEALAQLGRLNLGRLTGGGALVETVILPLSSCTALQLELRGCPALTHPA